VLLLLWLLLLLPQPLLQPLLLLAQLFPAAPSLVGQQGLVYRLLVVPAAGSVQFLLAEPKLVRLPVVLQVVPAQASAQLRGRRLERLPLSARSATS